MKKNSFKRILSFFLAAVMLFGMLPAVFAQDADTKDVDYAIQTPTPRLTGKTTANTRRACTTTA